MVKRSSCFLLFIFTLLILLPFRRGQAQVGEPWGDVVPEVSFGYGAMLTVDWSPLNGQLAIASEHGFQFYNEAMRMEGERRFEEPLVGQVLFSPDMRLVALQEQGGLVIRDTHTWEPIFTLTNYSAPSWSPDGTQLAVWVGDSLRVWDVRQAEITLEVNQLVSQNVPVQWSPESDVIALPGPGAIIMVRTDTGEIVNIYPFERIASFDWSADGRWFTIVGQKDPLPENLDPNIPVMMDLMRMDAVTGEIVAYYDLNSGGRTGSVYGATGFAAISSNGKYLAAAIQRWEPPDPADTQHPDARWGNVGLGVWELESGRPLHDFSDLERPLARANAVAWNPYGTHFATANGSELTIYEAESGEIVDSTQAYINQAYQTEWNSYGQLIAAGGLWDIEGDQPMFISTAPTPPPVEGPDLEFLKPNPYVFDYNRPPYEWKILQVYEDRNLVLTYEIDIEYPGTPEYEDEIDPEERYKIWDIATGRMLEERSYLKLQTAWLYDLPNADIRADGNTQRNVNDSTRFVGIGDDEIVDLRAYTETKLEISQQERWQYREVWFSPDGSRIFAYEVDNSFKAFDPVTGKLLYQTAVANRNSQRWVSDLSMFTIMDNTATIFVYDALTGDLLLEAFTGNQSPQMLWSSDLSYLAIGGDNRGIVIYHVPTRTRMTVLRGHQAPITSMGWNPDCDLALYQTCRHLFASSDADGRIILWGVPQQQQVVMNLPEAPTDPMLATAVPAVDFSQLTPLWTYIDPVEQYGKPAVQQMRWVPGVIRVNGSFYYDENLLPMEEEAIREIPRETVWYELEETAEQVRLREDNRGNRQWEVLALGLERNGTLYDTEKGWIVDNLGTGGQVYDATFSEDATIVYTAENDGGINEFSGYIGETVIYGHEGRRRMVRWGGGYPGYNQIALAPDGSWLATATIPYYGVGARGQIWHPTERYQLASLIGHTDTITQLVWHPYDSTVITSSQDGSVRKWDLNGRQVARWNHDNRSPIVQMEWVGSALMASAGKDLYLLNATDLSVIRTYAGVGGGTFDRSPEGTRVLALGYDSVLRVVSTLNNDVLAAERRHTPTLSHIAWHPSGDHLVVARTDGSIVAFDTLTGEVLRVLRADGPELRSMEWDAAGERLLLDPIDVPYVQIIDGDTGAILQTIYNKWRRPGVWWSPDGTKIAFGTYPDPDMGVYTATSLVWIHDAQTGNALHQLALDWDDYIWYWEKKPVYLSWSEAGDYLAAFYGKERLRVWALNSYNGQILGTHYGVGRHFSLGLWDAERFRFWLADGHGEYALSSDQLTYFNRDGLPQSTMLRPDGRVFLAGNSILDRNTFYPLQQITATYADAAWHPFCWSSDCPAMLAVSSGNTITMFGFPKPTAMQEGQ